MSEGLWFRETHTDNLGYGVRVDEILCSTRTRFQDAVIADTTPFGLALFLDGKVQSAALDEALYHELLVQPSMLSHPQPSSVLILGGGEGATLREALKHQCVERAVMVDIDEELVRLCEKHLSGWSRGAFDDPRTELVFTDARGWLEGCGERFDIILGDLAEPLPQSPAGLLYTVEFYETVRAHLNGDGLFCTQAGGADRHYPHMFAGVASTLKETFPATGAYSEFIESFRLPWGFVVASDGPEPPWTDTSLLARRARERGIILREYSPEAHDRYFRLPQHLDGPFREALPFRDEAPFVWNA